MEASTYQQNRQKLLLELTQIKEIYEELKYKDTSFLNELPQETSQRLNLIDREITRLRNPNLTIAFVGGFSAGKSSLINAFLGRYLLPESTEVTTAVPTYVRSCSGQEYARIHHLSISEIEELDELYRREIAETFHMPHLANAPVHELFEKVEPMVQEGRGVRLVENFKLFLDRRKSHQFSTERHIEECSIEEMQFLVRDESKSIFLDRVEVFIQASDIPSDIILVDLPGVSVPNPRHRQVTFRFVSQEAHAIIFVLMATRLFDRDEMEIMEKIRAGESQINRKTFWVLNRWDSLSSQQQQSSLANFRSQMKEFAIPDDYSFFTTNALHGFLAQLGIQGERPSDSKLQQHLSDYEEILNLKYEGKHKVAFQESQIPALRDSVLEFLNQDLRRITLETAITNVEQNFSQPILYHLRVRKEADESLVQGELQQSEREEAKKLTTEHIARRKKELEEGIRQIRDRVATSKGTMFTDRVEGQELESTLKQEIKNGELTDAYHAYTRIISDNSLRKYPYYFEIEIKVVDNLNQLLKQRFLEIIKQQVNNVVEDLVITVNNFLEKFYQDIEYDPSVVSDFKEVMQDVKNRFEREVIGLVQGKAASLDELLVYKKPEQNSISSFLKSGKRFSEGNEILNGLEIAARMESQRMSDSFQSIRKEDMEARTNQIRTTLEQHYIEKIKKFCNYVAGEVWPGLIKKIQELEEELYRVMNTRYLTILEQIKSKQAANEFAVHRSALDNRTKRFRSIIEKVDDLSRQMRSLLQYVDR